MRLLFKIIAIKSVLCPWIRVFPQVNQKVVDGAIEVVSEGNRKMFAAKIDG